MKKMYLYICGFAECRFEFRIYFIISRFTSLKCDYDLFTIALNQYHHFKMRTIKKVQREQ